MNDEWSDPEAQANPEDAGEPAVAVPIEALEAHVLRAVIESFINREGTDYGERERSLDEKVADVMRQLEVGSARIVFDPESETVTIVESDNLPD